MKVAYQSISLKNTVAEIVRTPNMLLVFLFLFCTGVISLTLMRFSGSLMRNFLLSIVTISLTLYQNGYSISYAQRVYLFSQAGFPSLFDWKNHLRRGLGKIIILIILFAVSVLLLLVPEILLTSVFSIGWDGLFARILALVPAVILSAFWWIAYVYSDEVFFRHKSLIHKNFMQCAKALIVIILIEMSLVFFTQINNELIRALTPLSAALFIALQSLWRAVGLLLVGNLLGQSARMVYTQTDSAELPMRTDGVFEGEQH
ncbi:MAG: hypothetical protein FWG78_02030 [Coriobacteriia bacterium]|nr:hypothetical protein [Coriobacteriia bacterium]